MSKVNVSVHVPGYVFIIGTVYFETMSCFITITFITLFCNNLFHSTGRNINSLKRISDLELILSTMEERILVSSPINDLVKASTERWVKELIVKENICPFANLEKYQRSIHVCNTLSLIDAMEYASIHVKHLMSNNQNKISTKLIVFPNNIFMNDINQLRIIGGYAKQLDLGAYIVLFHPNALRSNENNEILPHDDPIHFSMRSPYPTLHLFKSKDAFNEVIKYLTLFNKLTFPFQSEHIDEIIERNKITLRRIGYPNLMKQLQSFYEIT